MQGGENYVGVYLKMCRHRRVGLLWDVVLLGA